MNAPRLVFCLVLTMSLTSLVPSGIAGELTKNDIIRALTPEPLTRAWSRGIAVEPGAEPVGPPSVDLYVTFAFDSDILDTDAALTLDNLGRALADPALAEYRFMIAGHTDAKGTDDYNFALSNRRAAAVRRYLVDRYGVAADRLDSVGLGESHLLDATRPEDGVNRRVQVVNISAPAARTN